MITIIRDDITKVTADVIVNAANSSLLGGGGVDGAIHRVGGPEIMEDCKRIIARQGGCKTGDAVITTAGRLPAKYVIHTVGPVWHGGCKDEKVKLQNCYLNSLRLAIENSCKSIAFPSISTGIYGYPKKMAAATAIKTVRDFLANHSGLEVIFVTFDRESEQIMQEEFQRK